MNLAQGRKPASSDDQHVSKLAWDLLKCASFTAATLKHLEDTFGSDSVVLS